MEKTQILIVDDEKLVTMLARGALNMHGYEVTESNDPVQAVEIVKSRQFAMILVDIMMPKMTVVDFIRAAKATELNANAHYAVLTAKRLSQEDRREIFDLGAQVMSKPFIPQKLVEWVGEILR